MCNPSCLHSHAHTHTHTHAHAMAGPQQGATAAHSFLLPSNRRPLQKKLRHLGRSKSHAFQRRKKKSHQTILPMDTRILILSSLVKSILFKKTSILAFYTELTLTPYILTCYLKTPRTRTRERVWSLWLVRPHRKKPGGICTREDLLSHV